MQNIFCLARLVGVGSKPRTSPNIVAITLASDGEQIAGKHIAKSNVIPCDLIKAPLKVDKIINLLNCIK